MLKVFSFIMICALSVSAAAQTQTQIEEQSLATIQWWKSLSTDSKVEYLKSERLFYKGLADSLATVKKYRYAGLIVGIPADLLAMAQYGTARSALWELKAGEKGVMKLGQELSSTLERTTANGFINGTDRLIGKSIRAAEVPLNGSEKIAIFNAKLVMATATPVVGVSVWYFFDAAHIDKWIVSSLQSVQSLNAAIAGLQTLAK